MYFRKLPVKTYKLINNVKLNKIKLHFKRSLAKAYKLINKMKIKKKIRG